MSSSHHGSAAPCALCDSYPMHPMGPPQGIAGLPLPGYHTLNLKRGTYSQISAANSIYGANGHAPQQPPQPDEIVETLRRLRSHSVSPPKGSADFWGVQNILTDFDKISNLTKILHPLWFLPQAPQWATEGLPLQVYEPYTSRRKHTLRSAGPTACIGPTGTLPSWMKLWRRWDG